MYKRQPLERKVALGLSGHGPSKLPSLLRASKVNVPCPYRHAEEFLKSASAGRVTDVNWSCGYALRYGAEWAGQAPPLQVKSMARKITRKIKRGP